MYRRRKLRASRGSTTVSFQMCELTSGLLRLLTAAIGTIRTFRDVRFLPLLEEKRT
jgi:hypothetical protein